MECVDQAVLARILVFLSAKDICSLCCVSRKMNVACSADEIWRRLYTTTFHPASAAPPPSPPVGSWKACYLRQHALVRRVDMCRRKVDAAPRDASHGCGGWTEHELMIREAVELGFEDVL
jgi:hypothetical protein